MIAEKNNPISKYLSHVVKFFVPTVYGDSEMRREELFRIEKNEMSKKIFLKLDGKIVLDVPLISNVKKFTIFGNSYLMNSSMHTLPIFLTEQDGTKVGSASKANNNLFFNVEKGYPLYLILPLLIFVQMYEGRNI